MKTDAHAHSQLDADFGNGSPATQYIGFTTTVPTPTAAGTEAAGGGYARIAVTNNATNFPAATGRQKRLATAVETIVASAAIGKIYGVNFWDAATAGARKRFALLADAFGFLGSAIAAGDLITVPGHNLVVNDEVLARSIPGSTSSGSGFSSSSTVPRYGP